MFPEINVFCQLGLLEVCLRVHLMPHNDNYQSFFEQLHIPAIITDEQMNPAFQTAAAFRASKEQLQQALQGPVYLEEDLCLLGIPVRGGYTFWIEDEGGLRRMNEQLIEANETLSLENELIAREHQMKEEQSHVASRNRIYNRIAEELYPVQKKTSKLLDEIDPVSGILRCTGGSDQRRENLFHIGTGLRIV